VIHKMELDVVYQHSVVLGREIIPIINHHIVVSCDFVIGVHLVIVERLVMIQSTGSCAGPKREDSYVSDQSIVLLNYNKPVNAFNRCISNYIL
jgi:hypothetical protein